tara:strand:+ start:137 stop:442 length:306 start_codon:yes stop_codon:yes gene_type:complete
MSRSRTREKADGYFPGGVFLGDSVSGYQEFTSEDATSAAPLKKPVPTYASGRLARMDYASGAFKEFAYSPDGKLYTITLTQDGVVTMDTFNWVDGIFNGIT